MEKDSSPNIQTTEVLTSDEIEWLDWAKTATPETVAKKLASQEARLRLAGRDSLTGLLNRDGLMLNMEMITSKSVRENTQPFIALIDMDNLKTVNDIQGHDAGDKALVNIAEALKKSVRLGTDYVVRWGGDEFVILGFVENEEDISIIENRVKTNIQENGLSASMGSTFWDTSVPFEKIYKEIDQKMYLEKKGKKIKDVK